MGHRITSYCINCSSYFYLRGQFLAQTIFSDYSLISLKVVPVKICSLKVRLS